MKSIQPSPLLKQALFADALISGAVALLQVGPTAMLAGLLQLPPALLQATGLFLVGYVALLLGLARAARVWAPLIGLVVLGNVGWAVGCVALLVSGAVVPSGLGTLFVWVQAVTVLLFAALQGRGLRLSPAVPAGPAVRHATTR